MQPHHRNNSHFIRCSSDMNRFHPPIKRNNAFNLFKFEFNGLFCIFRFRIVSQWNIFSFIFFLLLRCNNSNSIDNTIVITINTLTMATTAIAVAATQCNRAVLYARRTLFAFCQSIIAMTRSVVFRSFFSFHSKYSNYILFHCDCAVQLYFF